MKLLQEFRCKVLSRPEAALLRNLRNVKSSKIKKSKLTPKWWTLRHDVKLLLGKAASVLAEMPYSIHFAMSLFAGCCAGVAANGIKWDALRFSESLDGDQPETPCNTQFLVARFKTIVKVLPKTSFARSPFFANKSRPNKSKPVPTSRPDSLSAPQPGVTDVTTSQACTAPPPPPSPQCFQTTEEVSPARPKTDSAMATPQPGAGQTDSAMATPQPGAGPTASTCATPQPLMKKKTARKSQKASTTTTSPLHSSEPITPNANPRHSEPKSTQQLEKISPQSVAALDTNANCDAKNKRKLANADATHTSQPSKRKKSSNILSFFTKKNTILTKTPNT